MILNHLYALYTRGTWSVRARRAADYYLIAGPNLYLGTVTGLVNHLARLKCDVNANREVGKL